MVLRVLFSATAGKLSTFHKNDHSNRSGHDLNAKKISKPCSSFFSFTVACSVGCGIPWKTYQIFNLNNGFKLPGQKDHILLVSILGLSWYLYRCCRKPLEFGSMSWLNGCKISVLTLTVNAKGDGKHWCICITCKMMGGDDGGDHPEWG